MIKFKNNTIFNKQIKKQNLTDDERYKKLQIMQMQSKKLDLAEQDLTKAQKHFKMI